MDLDLDLDSAIAGLVTSLVATSNQCNDTKTQQLLNMYPQPGLSVDNLIRWLMSPLSSLSSQLLGYGTDKLNLH